MMDAVDSPGLAARRAWLEETRRAQGVARNELARREERWSWSRAGAFLAFVCVWFLPLGLEYRFPVAGVALAGFAACVVRHLSLRQHRELADLRLLMIEESGQRLGGAIVCLRSGARPTDDPDLDRWIPPISEDGPTWPLSEQERGDLDLYSLPVGVFALLNRTSTEIGARRLRDILENPCLAHEPIAQRQAAVRWLAEHSAERLRLMAAVATLRQEQRRLRGLLAAIHGAEPLRLPVPSPLLRVWSLMTGAVTLVSAAQLMAGQWAWQAPLYAVLTINLALLFPIRKRLAGALSPWRDVGWAVRGFAAVVRQADADMPREAPGALGPLAEALRGAPERALNGLARRLAWTDSGGAVHGLLNLIVLHDVHLAASIDRRVTPRRTALLRAWSAMGELEALACLAGLAWEQPVACLPEFSEEAGVTIRGGRHPLVPRERVVANDVELKPDGPRVAIITGSNMAGKSTFLRMTGLCVLLAQVGGMAPAIAMRLSRLRLMTDLRATDSLARDESYFLAEVRQLRRMLDPPHDGIRLLGLIDEPFRGTNSHDQSAASVAVVRRLLASGNLFLLATHDRHLTRLADGVAARNYHFRENLGSDGMVFDYKLHEGPAQSRNALLILEKEGYPAELVSDARAWQAEDEPVA